MGLNTINSWKGRKPFLSVGTVLSSSKRRSRIHHSNSQRDEIPAQVLDRKHERAIRLESLSRRLIRRDTIECFANNCENIWEDWTSLLRKTILPTNVASSDARVIAAFRAVDRAISGTQSTYALRWLAYVQLIALYDSLKLVVRAERENGKAHQERGDRDINAVIDIYENAQRPSDRPRSRDMILEYRRTGKRVKSLAGPSPLFLLIYSDEAETVMYRVSYMSRQLFLPLLIILQQRHQKDSQPNFDARRDQNSPEASYAICPLLYSSCSRSRTGNQIQSLSKHT